MSGEERMNLNDLKLIKFNGIKNYILGYNAKIRNIENCYDENNNIYFKMRIIPISYDVTNLGKVKKLCNEIGLDFQSVFTQDLERINGYRDYHDCIFTPKESFLKNNLLEKVMEMKEE